MTKLIIAGHGGYGSAMRRNLNMLIGETDGYIYVDFDESDDLNILREKLAQALTETADCDVLFCCDLAAGSPFREAAALCAGNSRYACVAGLNTSAYTEMSFNLEDMSAVELAQMACDVAKQSIMQFPPVE